ncbi:hypothetical protein AB832_07335 [Flavobacteriaceae bacterium (ex Bugula neritina AB1)]|nr:hypothetical protein AB832_07335 [Flavobacteriaceae bacterium (ex Bugula neritina AB1)]
MLTKASEQAVETSQKLNKVVEGLENETVKTDSGDPIPTVRNVIKTIQTTVDGQIDYFSKVVDDVTEQADRAEAAETGAVTAKIAAETAQSAAETAETNAETAETGAESAKSAAQAAETNAETAQAAAKTAETNAETAQAAAQAAAQAVETNAETAKAAAETAETNAETAQAAAVTAETAKAAAETAETNAETAKVAAETAETNAETAKVAAETAETNAETAQAASENAQSSAESAQSIAETAAATATTKATEASDSETTATTQAGVATDAADRAEAAADEAENAIKLAAVPYPDFWLPLNDSLKIEAGYGTHDQIDVSSGQDGSVMVDLPSKSADFTRSTTATYIDKSGVMRTAGINEPRFEKDGVLIEGGSTNYYLNSEDSSEWGNTNSNITIDSSVKNIELKDSVKLTSNNVSSVAISKTTLISEVSINDKVTQSIYLKNDNGLIGVRLRFSNSTGVYAGSRYLYFDGSNSGDDYVTGTIKEVRDGWFRATATVTVQSDKAGTSFQANAWMIGENDNVTEVPSGTSGYFGQMQAEILPFPSSYIPTNGTPVTRSSDYVTFKGENLPSGSMTIVFETSRTEHTGHTDGISNRYFTTEGSINYASGYVSFTGSRSGAVFENKDLLHTESATKTFVYVKDADSLKGSLYVSGVIESTVYTENSYSPANVILGRYSDNNDGRNIYGHLRNFRIWHKALTDEQINSLA